MKQTALEWLIEQWPILEYTIPERMLDEAKAMEKEQSHAEYMQGWKDGLTKQETNESNT